jgi:hypothetical protein
MENPNWEGVLVGFVVFFLVWYFFLKVSFTNQKSDIDASKCAQGQVVAPTWGCYTPPAK